MTSNPLAQFDHSDDPLPLIVARQWNFPLQVHVRKRAYYYAVQDWIAGLARDADENSVLEAPNPQQAAKIWRKYQIQLSTSKRYLTSVVKLPYIAADGKHYQLDFTTDHDLYIIAADMRTTKTRPTLAAIKKFLADAGAFLDIGRRDPAALLDAATASYQKQGKSQNWIDNRVQGMASRSSAIAASRSSTAPSRIPPHDGSSCASTCPAHSANPTSTISAQCFIAPPPYVLRRLPVS